MTKIDLKMTYDPEADACYLRLGEGEHYESEEVAPGVILDFDRQNRVVAIEILSASKTLGPAVLPAKEEQVPA